MNDPALAILGTGMVSSVGHSAPAACAAIRAGLANPAETAFVDAHGARIMSHGVALEKPLRGRPKLAQMAVMVIEECLGEIPRERWQETALLLCVAERTRPGRAEGLDDLLIEEIQALLGVRFAPGSTSVPHGRVAAAVALLQARKMLAGAAVSTVLIVGTDSLLSWPTLRVLESQQRLLTERNPNGFIPGEGAAAVLVGKAGGEARLRVRGLGFATEQASIETDEPLRADGLTNAIVAALADAGCTMQDMDFRITDLSGEHYYFKEAALALTRTLRRGKEAFDLWHPAECIGEAGSALGPALLAVADASCRKGYACGPGVLLHMANDAGQRAAIVLRQDGG